VNLSNSSEPVRLEPVRQANQRGPKTSMHISYLPSN
jgi:hypothetical protein